MGGSVAMTSCHRTGISRRTMRMPTVNAHAPKSPSTTPEPQLTLTATLETDALSRFITSFTSILWLLVKYKAKDTRSSTLLPRKNELSLGRRVAAAGRRVALLTHILET